MMTRLWCLHLCLALAILAGNAASQGTSDIINVNMFLVNATFNDLDKDNYSLKTADINARVSDYFSPVGGQRVYIHVSDGGNCVQVNISFRYGNQTILSEVLENLQRNGFSISGHIYGVSFGGCSAGLSLARFTFYVVSLPWSENFRNHSSSEYQTVMETFKNTTGLGGNLQALEMAQNSACITIYMEWNAENSTSILDITQPLMANGIMLFDAHYNTASRCTSPPVESSLARFTFYVVSLPWSENFRNHSSSEYQTVMQTVKDITGLGDRLQALEIAQNYQCVEIYMEWNAEDPSSILLITETLTSYGINLFDARYNTKGSRCTASPDETNLLRFTFYVVNMQWSENFKNHNSAEYQELTQDVVTYFSGLGGSIGALEITKNYGCLEFYVEWSAADAASIIDFMSVLNTKVITVLNGTYTVQHQPCVALADDCAEVTEGYMGICQTACDFDNSSTLPQCSEGSRCCFTGCGYTCQRVGYVLTINSAILTDMHPVGNSSQIFDTLFQLQSVVLNLFQRNFNMDIPDLVKDVELRDMSPYMVDNQDLTVLSVTLYMSQDVPNEKLEQYKARLLKDRGGNIESGYFRIIDVLFRSNFAAATSMCDGTECHGVCKVYRPDQQHCSCDLGYVGSDCATFDCRIGMDVSNSTNGSSSLCQNGGKCVRKQGGLDYECQCQPGSTGPLCQVDLNSCPVLMPRKPGLIGLCRSTCFGDDCGEDQKCCQVSCGGQACVEIGYEQKLAASMTVDFPFTAELNDTNSQEFQILSTHFGKWINDYIRQKSVQGFKSAKTVGLQSSLAEQVTRKRRALGYTVINMELHFTRKVPVESMYDIRDNLLASGVNDGINNWTVLNITFGTDGNCPDVSCAAKSLCVTNFGGYDMCACPKHKSGLLCEIFNCIPDGINVCKNGGTCNYSNTDMRMFCECPKGYSGELCEELTDFCALGGCLNGGTCYNLPGGRQYCACPKGFGGSVCEDADNHCRSGQPLMTTSGERTCPRGRPCPMGFECNVDPIDRWTACCLKQDVFCDRSPCKEGGNCISDFNTGTMCQCPQGRMGMFCEETANDTMVPTACQTKQQFSDWVINILATGDSSVVTVEELRVILQHMGYRYFPGDLCDEQGNFKSVVQGVLVVNPSAQSVLICMDKSGNSDSSCAAAICDVLSNTGNMPFCINGGRCIGDITQKLCDCMGTGYHGIRCELTGEDNNETDCKLRQDIAHLALEILNGTVDSMLGLNREATQTALKKILSLSDADNIFVPYCDAAGRYENRGCRYNTADTSQKICYCALDDGTIFGSEENPWEPPRNCQSGSCPEEWGEECEQPDWWCLDSVQCKPGMERCAYFTGCTGDACKQQAEVGCVAKGITLSCDPHACKDDPFRICQACGTYGSCFNVGSVNSTADMGYRCECKMGFSGPECYMNDNVCASIPEDFCESECIGDIEHGVLCQCEPGYGGVFCDKPARSLCEKQKALFDDIINILNGTINPYNGHTVAEMQAFVKFIAQAVDAEEIQVLNCTDKGFYAKVQCSVSVSNLEDKECTCVDFYGDMISSNIKPYIGYDICTTPSDPQALAASACNASAYLGSGVSSVCFNGGSCAFDLYAGKFCSCLPGYYGQFCQYQGDASEYNESRSVCEFFAEAWNTAQEIYTGGADWIFTDAQKQFYLNLSLSFLKMQDNTSYALKAECHDDGTFKPAACYYSLDTGKKGPCYCWNLRQLLVEGLPVESSESSQCTDMSDSSCPKLKCHYNCEQGYRVNNMGCQTCDCKNPCEDVTCEEGQRCVIVKSKSCGGDVLDLCGQAVCRSTDKPGACPDYSVDLYQGELLEFVRNSSSCNVTCYDDTDCEGDMKCCGLCGSKCVHPQATNSCQDYQLKMEAQLQFITMARDEYMTTRKLSPADMRMFERITDVKSIWIPSCEDKGIQFTPVQCEFDVRSSSASISSCFCVDHWGKRIEGAHANSSDSSSCDIKPYTCPFVDVYTDTAEACTRDLDCEGSQKCCGNKMCQTPVDESTLTTTLDTFMSNLCEENSDMCQGASQCVGAWSDRGVACDCASNRMGPFCEMLVGDVRNMPRTTCERKSFALQVFLRELSGASSSLNLTKRLFPTSDNMKISITTAVMYNCTADGEFEPKQCIVNAQTMISTEQCFCVFENGTEIVGTRKPKTDGQSVFCGSNDKICPRGDAYRGNNGELQLCTGEGDCPEGYLCHRSTYGRLYCCPPDKDDSIPCSKTGVKTCSESICTAAMQQNCSNNPCAVCKLDPCTCQPYFVHASTYNRLTQDQCAYLSVGLCEAKTCAVINKYEQANQKSGLLIPESDLPNCDDKGIFEPMQCVDATCQCVDQFGKTTGSNADGICKSIEKIKRITATFTYLANFNDFKSNNRLQALVEMLRKKLIAAGVDPVIIRNTGDPYEGSVKVNMTFENTANSQNKDMAMVSEKMETMAKSGELNLNIDGQDAVLSSIDQEFTTESQISGGGSEKEPTHGDGDQLTTTEKIIIGVVCGAVGLLIIFIITFCLCYKRKEQKQALDDSFEHVRVHESKNPPSDSPVPVYNHMFEDDDSNCTKVRL